jgi:hypothetical protein
MQGRCAQVLTNAVSALTGVHLPAFSVFALPRKSLLFALQ